MLWGIPQCETDNSQRRNQRVH